MPNITLWINPVYCETKLRRYGFDCPFLSTGTYCYYFKKMVGQEWKNEKMRLMRIRECLRRFR